MTDLDFDTLYARAKELEGKELGWHDPFIVETPSADYRLNGQTLQRRWTIYIHCDAAGFDPKNPHKDEWRDVPPA